MQIVCLCKFRLWGQTFQHWYFKLKALQQYTRTQSGYHSVPRSEHNSAYREKHTTLTTRMLFQAELLQNAPERTTRG